MSHFAIRAERLSKRYRLGERQQYKTLRDTLAGIVRRPRLAPGAGGKGRASVRPFLWALKDLTFDVRQGEVIGIIGRNGAGKTTLLKVLSRITEPTSGMAVIHGRVGALLEVGTGFHPELTGRENIYLSGAILGMRKGEIERKFDEIVAFAGVESFMDTPVKHYSSGMYVRLAFAVAAHLEPEILVVDEVLAVGDMEFQKKCLGKMQGVASQGRTVLFVSHNLAAMAQLCHRGLLLDQGQLVTSGPMPEVIEAYLRSGANRDAEVRFPEDANKMVQVTSLQITDARGEPSVDLDRGKPVQVVVEVLAHQAARATVLFQLSTAQGVRICQSVCADALRRYSVFGPRERRRFVVQLPSEVLNEGTYRATVYVIPSNTAPYDAVESALFSLHDVESRDSFLGERKRDISVLRLPLEWSEQEAGDARPSRGASAGAAA